MASKQQESCDDLRRCDISSVTLSLTEILLAQAIEWLYSAHSDIVRMRSCEINNNFLQRTPLTAVNCFSGWLSQRKLLAQYLSRVISTDLKLSGNRLNWCPCVWNVPSEKCSMLFTQSWTSIRVIKVHPDESSGWCIVWSQLNFLHSSTCSIG